jgi:FMN-dependent oxidoreductase (nitrilotriacetate monooxygenase family)
MPWNPEKAGTYMAADRTLHLGYMYWANGTHPAGWRYPGATRDRVFDPDYIADVARRVEEATFDFFFLGDRLATGTEYQYTNTAVLARPEPFTAATYVATRTSRIGIAVTANTTYSEPFNIARLTASLDHITAGRAAWNLVTGADPRAAANFSRAEHGDSDARHDRADEFVSLVRQLWDTWEDGAFVRNKETGEFVDGTKIHVLNHVGAAFQVRGPLNLSRPPQGHPVVLHAGTSERSRALAAREADVVFGGASTIEDAVAYVADMRARAAALGRDPARLLVLPGLTPLAGATLGEARAIHDQLNELIVLDEDIRFGGAGPEGWPLDAAPAPREDQGPGRRNLGALSQRLGVDVTAASLSGVVSRALADAASLGGQRLIATAAGRTGRVAGKDLTWRDVLYAHVWGGHVVVGGPAEIADYMQRWLRTGACDGFNIQSAFLAGQLDAFIQLVVPELRERGLLRAEYAGTTLREHLGLPRPASTLTAGRLAARARSEGAAV